MFSKLSYLSIGGIFCAPQHSRDHDHVVMLQAQRASVHKAEVKMGDGLEDLRRHIDSIRMMDDDAFIKQAMDHPENAQQAAWAIVYCGDGCGINLWHNWMRFIGKDRWHLRDEYHYQNIVNNYL